MGQDKKGEQPKNFDTPKKEQQPKKVEQIQKSEQPKKIENINKPKEIQILKIVYLNLNKYKIVKSLLN